MKNPKIVAPEELFAVCRKRRNDGAVIVFTNGVFDLLHPGHMDYLSEAKKLGTDLLVAVNSDASTQRLKGSNRPLMQLIDRMEILAALEQVSSVTWFEEDTPAAVIRLVRPDILVKGGDWKLDEIVGRDFVESYGGKVIRIPLTPGYSTTKMIEKILKL